MINETDQDYQLSINNINYVINGQKGIENFVKDKLLKHDN